MVPLPIALLSLFYAVIATLSVAAVWRILNGASQQPLPWAVGWLIVSVGAVCGLPLLKSWARVLAIVGAVGLSLAFLAHAALLVAAGRPLLGLGATLTTSVPMIVIRYLRRPAVRALFRPVSDTPHGSPTGGI